MVSMTTIVLSLALACCYVSGAPSYRAAMSSYRHPMEYTASAPYYKHSMYKRSVPYAQPMTYAAPKMRYAVAAPTYRRSMYKRSSDYGAGSMTYAKEAPKMHYNYEEKNVYVPQTYTAPATYDRPAPKMHYNYEEKNVYVAPAKTYAAPTY